MQLQEANQFQVSAYLQLQNQNSQKKKKEKMDISSQAGEEKKKIPEMRTFSASFALGKIKNHHCSHEILLINPTKNK